MSSLLELPVIIIEEIVRYLCPHCHPAKSQDWPTGCNDACSIRSREPERHHALTSLCRTNKQLKYIATPILYHLFFNFSRPFLFARTLLGSRSDLAKHVKSIHVTSTDFDYCDWKYLSAEDSELITKATRRSENGQNSENENSEVPEFYTIDHESRPSMLGLLASTCKDIEELCIPVDWDGKCPLPFSSPSSLPRLKTLRVSHFDTENGFELAEVNDILVAAPNLMSLAACSVNGVGQGFQMTNIREIDLDESVLEVDSFSLLLDRCPQLERLSYFIGDGCVSDEEPATGRDMQDALSRKSPQLRILRLTMRDHVCWGNLTQSDMMRSLKGLAHLEELILDVGFLIPRFNDGQTRWITRNNGSSLEQEAPEDGFEPTALVSLLPTSIRKTEIVLCKPSAIVARSLLPAILRLGEFCDQDFPQLKAVRFPCVDGPDGAEAKELFESKGVSFGVNN